MERVPIRDDFDATRRPDGYRGGVTAITAARTVAKDDHGTFFKCTAAGGSITLALPSNVGAGFRVGAYKGEATTDIVFQAPAGQTINLGTAAKAYNAVTDAQAKALCELMFDGVSNWVIVAETGTWVNNNS